MKRIALLIIAMLTLGFAAQAQSTFSKGTTLLNMGIGAGLTKGLKVAVPPLVLSVDHSVAGNLFDGNGSIGVGGYVATEVTKFSADKSYYGTQTLIAARGTLHYQFVDRLDTYWCVLLGLHLETNPIYKFDSTYAKESDLGPGYGSFLGARYYLSNNWAMMLETGYSSVAFLTLGATYRF